MNKPEYWEALLDYLANPFDARPYEVFAESVGISQQALWRVRQNFREEIEHEVEKRRKSMFDAMRVQAYKSLAMKLKKDTNALKLFFQLSGDLIERSETVNKYETVEEKRSRINMLLQSLGLEIKNNPVNLKENNEISNKIPSADTK